MKLKFLGSGTSQGVPVIGCHCEVCTSKDHKDQRFRSSVLITTDAGKKILIDCGMFQGKGLETDGMNRNIGLEPSELHHIILSHAHIDHSGLIPYFYKLGFRGSVICTNATRNLCSIMLPDSGHIQEMDAKWFNKKQAKKKLPFILKKKDIRINRNMTAKELKIGTPVALQKKYVF